MLKRQVVGDIRGQRGRRCGRRRMSGVARRSRSWRRGNCVRRSGSGIRFAAEVSAFFVIPRGFVVAARRRVKSRVQAVFREFETLFNDESRVGVVDEIFLGDPVVLDRITDQAAKESYVSAGANLYKEVGSRGGARESGINRNQFGVAVALRLHRPLETTGMV